VNRGCSGTLEEPLSLAQGNLALERDSEEEGSLVATRARVHERKRERKKRKRILGISIFFFFVRKERETI